jgi:hypothetical protein
VGNNPKTTTTTTTTTTTDRHRGGSHGDDDNDLTTPTHTDSDDDTPAATTPDPGKRKKKLPPLLAWARYHPYGVIDYLIVLEFGQAAAGQPADVSHDLGACLTIDRRGLTTTTTTRDKTWCRSAYGR